MVDRKELLAIYAFQSVEERRFEYMLNSARRLQDAMAIHTFSTKLFLIRLSIAELLSALPGRRTR